MADNYLEHRMEDYRNGKLAPKHSALNSTRHSPLTDKRVLVTGGASGIGREIVAAFRENGCKVAIFDHNLKGGTDTAQRHGARFYPCELSDPDYIRKQFDALTNVWGDIDIIVNNAAECFFKPLTQTTSREFASTLAVNLTAPFELSRLLALHRSTTLLHGGRIINIASTRAFQSEAGTEAYSASKGGIIALTHALMASLSPFGITVNSISPGWINTGNECELRSIDHSFHPSGRVGKPRDIARACVFLAMPDADFINGTNLTIDGGVTRKMIYPD